MVSDVSSTGAAVILEDKLFTIERISHCEWDQVQSVKSSRFREMYAIWFGLCQFHALLFNQVLDWFTDSANTVSIVKRGSMIPELHNLAYHHFSPFVHKVILSLGLFGCLEIKFHVQISFLELSILTIGK